MIELSPGWELQVERGPDWLIVKVHAPASGPADLPPLAETVWAVLSQQFCHRLVLELDEIGMLHSYLVGQLVLLHKRITSQGGVMRICGLSAANEQVLRISRLDARLPNHANREEALLPGRPRRPR